MCLGQCASYSWDSHIGLTALPGKLQDRSPGWTIPTSPSLPCPGSGGGQQDSATLDTAPLPWGLNRDPGNNVSPPLAAPGKKGVAAQQPDRNSQGRGRGLAASSGLTSRSQCWPGVSLLWLPLLGSLGVSNQKGCLDPAYQAPFALGQPSTEAWVSSSLLTSPLSTLQKPTCLGWLKVRTQVRLSLPLNLSLHLLTREGWLQWGMGSRGRASPEAGLGEWKEQGGLHSQPGGMYPPGASLRPTSMMGQRITTIPSPL